MTLKYGTRLGPYEVTALLGSGGMAEVYRARDVRLGREVAIKILPEELSSDEESLSRFTREAQTASALNHPHLVTIYDIGEVDVGAQRLHYIAMELIRGETLRHHFAHASREVLLRYIAGVADGLAKAHDAGVVHRDLKPENVMVSDDDFAKVVDFGLAKHVMGFASERSAERLTAEGFCVGTLGYMAPEQVRGQRDIDGRADIFALGCMLYEAIVKENPFDGDTPVDTMHRVLHHEPSPLPDPVLDPIVRRCLAKDAAHRYSSMREVAAELRKAMTAPPSSTDSLPRIHSARRPAIASIAVLPFHNRSGSEEMRFLSDGIPEDIVRDLGRVAGLRVIANSSVSRFRETTDPRQAARELQVEAVLVGGLRMIGDKVVIDAELVKAADGSALWGKKYTRELTDVIELQQEISRDLCNEVRLELAPQRNRAPLPEAHDVYLRGKREIAKETPPALKKGIEQYHRAIELDPEYALPYAALGQIYGRMALLGIAPTRDCRRQQAALGNKASSLDEFLPEAHFDLAVAALLAGDMPEFERRIARVLDLNPNFAQAYAERSLALVSAQRYAEGEAAYQKARELDPLSPRVMTAYGGRLGVMRQWNECLTVLHNAAEQFPDYEHTYAYLGLVYSQIGRPQEAIATIERAPAETSPHILIWKAIVLARVGRIAEAQEIADRMDELAKTRFVLTYWRAQLRGELGDRDAAFALIEQGLRDEDCFYIFLPSDPGMDCLRSDSRFAAMLQLREDAFRRTASAPALSDRSR